MRLKRKAVTASSALASEMGVNREMFTAFSAATAGSDASKVIANASSEPTRTDFITTSEGDSTRRLLRGFRERHGSAPLVVEHHVLSDLHLLEVLFHAWAQDHSVALGTLKRHRPLGHVDRRDGSRK